MSNLADSATARISSEYVLRELETILASEIFIKAPRLSRFLRVAVERTLQGDLDGLKEYQLGLDVFGRSANYETRLDPVVRVEARQLRFKLAYYYDGPGRDDEVILTLPKGGYAVQWDLRTPVAPAVEPVVEAPPEPAPGAAPGATQERKHMGAYLAVAACLIAVAAIALWPRYHGEKPASIVVLPFKNLSADPANQYFTDGLTDEITDALSHLKTLRVIAATSAFQLKDKAVSNQSIGRELDVTNMLEGSVERYGDKTKIVARLKRVSDGSQIWSATYERRTADLFSVQSELAARIAASLKAATGLIAPAKHVPPGAAYDAYIQGRYDLQQASPTAPANARKHFQQAVDLDPAYAPAYLGLGSAIYNEASFRTRTDSERKAAEAAFRKALELDPDEAGAHAMLAALQMQYEWDWAEAERELRLALAGSSNSVAEGFYASFLVFQRRFNEADLHLQRAQEDDPFGTLTLTKIAFVRTMEGRYAEAAGLLNKTLSWAPESRAIRISLAFLQIAEGKPDSAIPQLQEIEKTFPQAKFYEAMAHARAGRREQALQLIRPFEEKYPNPGVPLQWFALVYGFAGDTKETAKWLGRSADQREWQALNLAVNPVFQSMEQSPEFHALKKRIGLEN